MSKFLVQSKSFLPMVIQKSSTVKVIPALIDNNTMCVAKQQPNFEIESKSKNPTTASPASQHKKTIQNPSTVLADACRNVTQENPILPENQCILKDLPSEKLQDPRSVSTIQLKKTPESPSVMLTDTRCNVVQENPSATLPENQCILTDLPSEKLQDPRSVSTSQLKKTPGSPSVMLTDTRCNVAQEKSSATFAENQPLKDLPSEKLQDKNSASIQLATTVVELASMSICQHKNDQTTIVVINPPGDRTLLAALQMDMALAQDSIARRLAKGHKWLLERAIRQLDQLKFLRTSQAKAIEVGPKRGVTSNANPREKEPVPVILPESIKQKQTYKAKRGSKKQESKREEPFRSNLLDAVQDRMPKWQEAVSNRLGLLQRAVMRKLAEREVKQNK